MDPHSVSRSAHSSSGQPAAQQPLPASDQHQAALGPPFSLATAILSLFAPAADHVDSNHNQARQQDWPTAQGNASAGQQQVSFYLGPTGDGRDNEQQQQPHQTLMSCVESLLKSEQTRAVAAELLDSARQQPPAELMSGPLHNQSLGGELNGSAWVNWTRLGERLPAIESNYRLEALSERWQFSLALIYSVTAITSFILNIVTVIVLIRSRRSELRKYLINLSLSDLLMSLFSIPFTYTEYMLGHWIFASFLCPMVRLVVTLSVFVSVATMTVIGINRHLAIMYPLKRKKYSKFRRWTIRKTHVIIAIWLLGIAISLPEFLMYNTQPFCYNRQLFYECRQSWGDSMANSYTIFIYMSTFVVPFSLLTYLYTCIGFKLWRREMPGNIDVNRDLTMQTQRTKVIKMLLVVVVLFAIFWLPLQTFSLVTFLYPNLRQGIVYQSLEYNIFIGTYFASHWLSMAHSCLNPLIYCFMNDKFRNNLHSLICAHDKRHAGSLYNYSVSRITQQSSYFRQTSSNQTAGDAKEVTRSSSANNDDDANSNTYSSKRRRSSAASESRKYQYYFQSTDESKNNNHQIIEHHHFHHHYNQRRRSSLLSGDGAAQDQTRSSDKSAAAANNNNSNGQKTTGHVVEMIEKPEALVLKQKSLLLSAADKKLVDLLKYQPVKSNGEQVFMRIIEQPEDDDDDDDAESDDKLGQSVESVRHVSLLNNTDNGSATTDEAGEQPRDERVGSPPTNL